MKKLLDMRFTIGVFFLIVGILVLGYYFTLGAAKEAATPNFWGGLLFLLFGLGMVVLSYFKQDAPENNE